MKLTHRLLSLILIFAMLLTMTVGCGEDTDGVGEPEPEKQPVILRVYIENGSITFGQEHLKDGIVPLPGGLAAEVGGLKPVWEALSAELGIAFEDKSSLASLDLGSVDIIVAGLEELESMAREGLLADLSAYSSLIPNLKRTLFEADLAYSLYGESEDSRSGIFYIPTIYDAPIFNMTPKLNEEVIRFLLDGDEPPECSENALEGISLTEYMPASGKITVKITEPESGRVTTVDKDYSGSGSGNILRIFKIMQSYGGLTGQSSVRALRDYIDCLYGGYYGSERSALFIGESALWDADELRALLVCIKANEDILSDYGISSPMQFADEESAVAAFGALFGARGLSVGGKFVFTDSDGYPRDARLEEETYIALNMLGECIRCGLVSYSDGGSCGSAVYFDGNSARDGYCEVLPPVAKWYNGTVYSEGVDLGAYFRFTDSVNLTADTGIAVLRSGASDPHRLAAALKLLDYMYSDEGKILTCYGIPAGKQQGLQYTSYMGIHVPVLSDSVYAEAESLGYGDVCVYMRDYLGAGICVSSSGRAALECAYSNEESLYSRSVARGTVEIPSFAWTDNEWYIAPRLTLPFTAAEYSHLMEYTALFESSGQEFKTIFSNVISQGFMALGNSNIESGLEALSNRLGADGYFLLLKKVYRRLEEYRDERRWEIEY